MIEEIEAHIAKVTDTYRSLVTKPGGRLIGGARLWDQFENAVIAFRKRGRGHFAGVIERVNELVVVRQLLMDQSLGSAAIEYEPEIVPNGTRFDFVTTDRANQPLYIEVKTVQPRTADTDSNWRKVEQRRKHLTDDNNHYVVAEEWMGAAIFGDSFSARSSFRAYTLETERKLSEHQLIQAGRGVLVFCGTGFAWHVSELEDFADYYSSGRHRIDDPFAEMERHAIAQDGKELSRTLEGFGAMLRPHDGKDPERWVYPVRGPSWGQLG